MTNVTESEPKESPYPEVRSLERGLSILDALGELGWSGATAISRQTGVDRGTVYRLLATMAKSGYVIRRPQDGRYFLSSRLREISTGIRDDDIWLQHVDPALERLVRKIHWPSDFATISGGKLTIVASNYPHTTMTLFRSVLGQARPIMRSSLGRAMIAAMSPDQLDRTIEMVSLIGGTDAEEIKDRTLLARIIETTRMRGFAASAGESTPGIAAIALPVMARHEVVGAVNIVIFMSSFNLAKSAATYLEPLKECVREIEQSLIGGELLNVEPGLGFHEDVVQARSGN